jgi:hypothetical protein
MQYHRSKIPIFAFNRPKWRVAGKYPFPEDNEALLQRLAQHFPGLPRVGYSEF